MENSTKLRILYIYQYLMQNTDKENKLSTEELKTALLEEYGIKANHNTISNDLITLRKGDLGVYFARSTQNKYYYDRRPLEVSELKTLIDIIASTRFITQRKSEELINKLLTLTSKQNAEKIRSHIVAEGRVRTDNEMVLDIIDVLNRAINQHRKIKFKYTDYNIKKELYLRNDGEYYTVSPHILVYSGDTFYLQGYCDERKAIREYRIDRIYEKPIIVEESAVPPDKETILTNKDYTVFSMMPSGTPKSVKLKCHKTIMKTIVDRFGKDVETELIPDEEDWFMANVKVDAGPMFYRWIFGFKGMVKLIAPDEVKKDYKEMLVKALQEIDEQQEGSDCAEQRKG